MENKLRCHNCQGNLNINDSYRAEVDGGFYNAEFCDEDCHRAHLDTEKLERGE